MKAKINKQRIFSDDGEINISILDNAPENLRSKYLDYLSKLRYGSEKTFSYFEKKEDYGWDYNNAESITMGLFIQWAKDNIADLEINKIKEKKQYREISFKVIRK